jgi:hypothetical protein
LPRHPDKEAEDVHVFREPSKEGRRLRGVDIIIRVGKTSIGANIEELSQFAEEEHVYPPPTLLELDKEPELSPDGKVLIIHLKTTADQRSTTVEDAE